MTQAASTTEQEYGVVKATKDYTRFRYMGGNRNLDVHHVKQLQLEMERQPTLFASMPILINENWYIIDGQHRYEAAKASSRPVYYIMQPEANLVDARHINIAQKRWSMMDFAKSYAGSGREDYKNLLDTNRRYPRIPLSIVAGYLSGRAPGGHASDEFRRGDFQIADEQDGIFALDVLQDVIGTYGRPANKAFASALWQVLHGGSFEAPVFLRKLNENPDALVMAGSVRACLRNVEEIYNRHNKIAIRLY